MAKINHVATGAWRGLISDFAQNAIDKAASIGRELEQRLDRIDRDRTRNQLGKLPMRKAAATVLATNHKSANGTSCASPMPCDRWSAQPNRCKKPFWPISTTTTRLTTA